MADSSLAESVDGDCKARLKISALGSTVRFWPDRRLRMKAIQNEGFSLEEVLSRFLERDRELVALLIEEARGEVHLDYEKAEPAFGAFLLHIGGNLTNTELTIGSARSAARIKSANTYATKFRKITGMRPRDYLEHHRVKLAQKILRHTTKVFIYDIAFAVGYEDQNLFSRNYKRIMGHSPTNEPKADASLHNEAC